MTTVQIIGIAVASLAVLLLIIALVVTRRHDDEPEAEARASSFLDEAPQDTFSGLGKAEHPVEDITLDPALERAAAARSEAAARQAAAAAQAAAEQVQVTGEQVQRDRQPQPGGLGLDWGPDLSVRATGFDAGPPGPRAESDDETTGELRPDDAAAVPAQHAPPAPEGKSGGQVAATQPARPAEGGSAAGEVAAAESGSGGHLVPLSDIIVTTSSKKVDIEDPDVRRMLTELVTFEIDQAAEFRRQGQSIDAILQLTEAEKVSRALGMTESARRIRAMMEELRGE
ncbi:MAG TPA: hypothetical protein VFZ86_12435 [Thermoleophilia bacterium]|nr:hypothetical protein [Thermoleophilia bacterium]